MGAILAPCVLWQARPKVLMELQSTVLLQSSYILLLEYDGGELLVELADVTKQCAQLLLRLVREHLQHKSQEELETLLHMVHPNVSFVFRLQKCAGKAVVRLVSRKCSSTGPKHSVEHGAERVLLPPLG